MSDADIQLKIRELFNKLPRSKQYTELKRMERIVFDKKPIKISSPKDPGRVKLFSDVPDIVKYLKNNGYPNASNSNIHKALNGERKSAYGHKMWYDKD